MGYISFIRAIHTTIICFSILLTNKKKKKNKIIRAINDWELESLVSFLDLIRYLRLNFYEVLHSNGDSLSTSWIGIWKLLIIYLLWDCLVIMGTWFFVYFGLIWLCLIRWLIYWLVEKKDLGGNKIKIFWMQSLFV